MPIELDIFKTGKIQTIRRSGITKKDGHTRHNYCEYRTKELLILLEKNKHNEGAREVLLSRGKYNKVNEILRGE